MIEFPEGIVLAKQLDSTLKNKRIKDVIADASHHKFAWYYGDPADYPATFTGKVVEGSYSYGGKLHLQLSEGCGFMFCDGTSLRYYTDKSQLPKKHQLYLEFDDSTYLVCTVQMYGGIYGYTGIFDNGYDYIARIKPSVLSEEFDLNYFIGLLGSDENESKPKPGKLRKNKLSAKAFLATEQRIPGLGNGVAQDILFNAGISPRSNIAGLSNEEFERLYTSTKDTLLEIIQKGGRDTETDIYGNRGGYRTIMSKNTYRNPCPRCGGEIIKEAYLGGSVYYCQGCQR